MSKVSAYAVYINSGSESILYGVYSDIAAAASLAVSLFKNSTTRIDVCVYDETDVRDSSGSKVMNGLKIIDFFHRPDE